MNPIAALEREREIKSTVERRMPYSRKNFDNEPTIMKSDFRDISKEKTAQSENWKKKLDDEWFLMSLLTGEILITPQKLKTNERECPEKYRSSITKSLNSHH